MCCCLVTKSCKIFCDPMDCSAPGFTRPSLSPGICSNSYPLSWYHLILCHVLLVLPSIFPSFRVFSNESVLCIRWPEYWWFSFSISPSNEYSGLISFRMDLLDLVLSKGLSRVFPSTTVHLFSPQPSLWSNNNIPTWLLREP